MWAEFCNHIELSREVGEEVNSESISRTYEALKRRDAARSYFNEAVEPEEISRAVIELKKAEMHYDQARRALYVEAKNRETDRKAEQHRVVDVKRNAHARYCWQQAMAWIKNKLGVRA